MLTGLDLTPGVDFRVGIAVVDSMANNDVLEPEKHEKPLQLGASLPNDNDEPVEITDPDEIDALWADVTTVEKFAADLAIIGGLSEREILELRADREAK